MFHPIVRRSAVCRLVVACAPLLTLACGGQPRDDQSQAGNATDPAPLVDYLAQENQYSQHGEELIIRDFFRDRRDGFFLDVGCAWPVRYSNTYYLESRLGWTGIGIDALPEYAERWLKRRRKSRFFNFIVTDHSGGPQTFYRTRRPDLRGVSSLHGGRGPVGQIEYEEIQIPTITLTDLLDQNDIAKIDLLTMDIEDAEPKALAGFDIDRFSPELVCVEAHVDVRTSLLEYFLHTATRVSSATPNETRSTTTSPARRAAEPAVADLDGRRWRALVVAGIRQRE